jgi:hypothetical protein
MSEENECREEENQYREEITIDYDALLETAHPDGKLSDAVNYSDLYEADAADLAVDGEEDPRFDNRTFERAISYLGDSIEHLDGRQVESITLPSPETDEMSITLPLPETDEIYRKLQQYITETIKSYLRTDHKVPSNIAVPLPELSPEDTKSEELESAVRLVDALQTQTYLDDAQIQVDIMLENRDGSAFEDTADYQAIQQAAPSFDWEPAFSIDMGEDMGHELIEAIDENEIERIKKHSSEG